MNITKAVITAAARNQRTLPLQTLVDRDGQTKSALRIQVEEALSAGVEEVCVVVCPGDETAYRQAAGDAADRLKFVEQHDPKGYGDAILCAREFTGDTPFLHLIGDHIYLSGSPRSCAAQIVEAAETHHCAVSGVQPTRESLLPYFGAVGGRRVAGSRNLYEVETVREKPTPTEAEQHLLIPGLRAGTYLCFFGLHVFTPAVMELLEKARQTSKETTLSLSPTLAALAGQERYLALETEGRRYPIDVKYGLLTAQLALALSGKDRDEVLTQLVELMAQK